MGFCWWGFCTLLEGLGKLIVERGGIMSYEASQFGDGMGIIGVVA